MERHQIDALKARVSLAGYLESRGHELKKNGTGVVTACPFHEDDTPSLSLDQELGLYHCFGCGKSGDILSYLQEAEELSFPQALERLSELAGGILADSQSGNGGPPEGAPATEQLPPAQTVPSARTQGLMERAAEVYQSALAQNQEALRYLIGRGITDLEMLRALRVGWAEGRQLSRMAGQGEAREGLRALGLINERGWDALTGCVVVPLRSREGRVTGFLGRRIRAGEGDPHRTLAGPRQGLFFPEAARGTAQVLLVEGFLDALACYQAGFRNVMALGGRVAGDELMRHLSLERVEEVLLGLDADAAGDQGAVDIAERLTRESIRSRRVELPVKDPADFFLSHTPAEFRELLEKAVPLGTAERALGMAEDDHLELMLTAGAFLYRARLLTAPSSGKLKALLRLEGPKGSHRDTLELYSHKARKIFANRAAERFEGLTPGEVEAQLERLIDQAEVLSRESVGAEEPLDTSMSDAEREEALDFLRRPDLKEAILADMEALGYVGEETAKLMVYLISVSRLLEKPLSGILRSESAAGKSFVVELAEQLTPPEGVVIYSRISALALAYSPEDSLKGKLLVLEERAGGEAADYAIRTLQSKKRLTQYVTIKDPSTGKMQAKSYTVRDRSPISRPPPAIT